MDAYDAFSGGVEPGGLRTRGEIKTLICYLVRALNNSLTKEQINDIMLSQGIANYFDVSDAFSELVSNGIIRSDASDDGHEHISITLRGEAALAPIEKNIPRAVREKAVNEGVRLVTIAKNAHDTETNIEPCGKGYTVNLGISDGEDSLMKLSLYVADFGQAELVRNRFLENPVSFYSNIVSKLY